jgi:hypothetical protein
VNRWIAPVVGFVVPFLVLGALYWPIAYSEVELPSSLPAFGLVVLAVSAMVLRGGTATPFWAAWLFPAAAVPAVVMARVVVETSSDPTSHNLWPFEVVIAVVVGGVVSALGFAVGELVRHLTRPKQPAGDPGLPPAAPPGR